MLPILFFLLAAQPGPPPPPGCPAPEHRAFDFWIGEWDVFSAQGQRVGANRIEKILGGCALLENWTDARGREGKSLNLYDTGRKKWHQLWMSDTGNTQDYWGEATPDGISFTDGVGRRMRFTRVSPDEVRQLIEISRDDGKTWQTGFDGTYRRQKK